MSHFITKCSCGVVLSQCRCFSKEKIENVVENGCSNCKKATSFEDGDLGKQLAAVFAGKGPFHPCGKCFKWKECVCDKEESKTDKEAKKQDKNQSAVALKKLHKGEQDQLAIEIKKKHVNKE